MLTGQVLSGSGIRHVSGENPIFGKDEEKLLNLIVLADEGQYITTHYS